MQVWNWSKFCKRQQVQLNLYTLNIRSQNTKEQYALFLFNYLLISRIFRPSKCEQPRTIATPLTYRFNYIHLHSKYKETAWLSFTDKSMQVTELQTTTCNCHVTNIPITTLIYHITLKNNILLKILMSKLKGGSQTRTKLRLFRMKSTPQKTKHNQTSSNRRGFRAAFVWRVAFRVSLFENRGVVPVKFLESPLSLYQDLVIEAGDVTTRKSGCGIRWFNAERSTWTGLKEAEQKVEEREERNRKREGKSGEMVYRQIRLGRGRPCSRGKSSPRFA